MDHLVDLMMMYPGMTLATPSCGANATYRVLKAFDRPAPPLDLLDRALGADKETKLTSMADIKAQLESAGLSTLACFLKEGFPADRNLVRGKIRASLKGYKAPASMEVLFVP